MEEQMQVHIRYATHEDYSAISNQFAEGDALHHQALPDRFRIAHPARDEAFIRDWLAREDAGMFVAEASQQVIGVVQFHIVASPERPTAYARTYVFVDSLVIQARHRQQGLGRALMEHVHSWAREHGILTIELNVFEFNQAAIQLYEQLGYQTISRRMQWQA
jgi:GNAT superfamily N-acetyltransferase